MMVFIIRLLLCTALLKKCSAWSPQQAGRQHNDVPVSRRSLLTTSSLSSAIVIGGASWWWWGGAPHTAGAFEGTGSSAYAGKNPTTQAAKVKSYRERIAADVKDFNALGAAIDQNETEGNAWVSFFIPYQRREPDAAGRTYAAQVDLIGVEKSGGAGLLLAGSYAKPNKPPDNLPQFKKYNALVKTLDPIKSAGKAGDAAKAKKEWLKAAAALSEYLETVELPADPSDALYK